MVENHPHEFTKTHLNKRHAKLVPKLAEALRALKREGFYRRIYHEKLLPYDKAGGR